MGIHAFLLHSLFYLASPGCPGALNREQLPRTSKVNYAGASRLPYYMLQLQCCIHPCMIIPYCCNHTHLHCMFVLRRAMYLCTSQCRMLAWIGPSPSERRLRCVHCLGSKGVQYSVLYYICYRVQDTIHLLGARMQLKINPELQQYYLRPVLQPQAFVASAGAVYCFPR